MNRSQWIILTSLLLSACATNKGDFGGDDVRTTQAEKKQPEYQDVKTEPRSEEETSAFMQPSLGVSTAIPRRGSGLINSLEEPHIAILPENLTDTVPQTDGSGKIIIPHQDEIKKHPKFSYLAHSHDGFGALRQRDNMEYVRSGWVMDPLVGLEFINGDFGNGITKKIVYGQVGYVYYQGIKPASSIPTESPTISYKGTWDFTSDAKKGRSRERFSGTAPKIGDYYGATSLNEADSVNTDKSKGEVATQANSPSILPIKQSLAACTGTARLKQTVRKKS